MQSFQPLLKKINNWQIDAVGPLKVTGVSPGQWSFLLQNFLKDQSSNFFEKNHIIICPNLETAENLRYAHSKKIDHTVKFYPGIEASPYSGIISSGQSLLSRLAILDELIHQKGPFVIFCTFEAFFLKIPPRAFFKEHSFTLSISDILPPPDLAKKLVGLGYSSSTTVEEPGTFCAKGEIFDIYPVSGKPLRLHYFDDMVEEIFAIDITTGKTKRDFPMESINICPSVGIFSDAQYRNKLRENIPMPGPGFKKRFEYRKEVFSNLGDNCLFDNYPVYAPLFFDNPETILDYLNPQETILHMVENASLVQESLEFMEQLREEFERESTNPESELLLPKPHSLYSPDIITTTEGVGAFKSILTNNLDVSAIEQDSLENKLEVQLEDTRIFLSRHINPSFDKFEYLKAALSFIKNHFSNNGTILFCTSHEASKKEIKYLLESEEFPGELINRIHFLDLNTTSGFYYEKEQILVITEGDLFSHKKKKAPSTSSKKIDLFAEQLATMKKGDYVIHNTHGLGEYLGLSTLNIGGSKTDYLVIQYTQDDKIYVPVYKVNLIQKHADSTADLKPSSLRSTKFSKIKERAKASAKKLAFDLLKLSAQRHSNPGYAYGPPDHTFREFELAFGFEETYDQITAINNVIDDMQKPIPMDHLVCGDVGFGKTEVAMRAAFKAVLDNKQVTVLVPTTILALQHYHSFCDRFKNFPVNIEFLSRFKTATQSRKIKEDLTEGKIDIIIGTHGLLASSVKYKNLGLVVVDEEQRFGVGHKEKLKLLRSTVDLLTLTATPIPRTLQLAFLGLRDLSLIQTAPPRRQSIKTYVIKEDKNAIKSAIEKELSRGGQVFIVHNRVHDIEDYSAKIRELVPKAKIVIAHGQLPEKELESRISAFYAGKFQILISTTIIESGLDIPNSNTMIIDRADTFGLAQLHQLRGRIGRSEKKAYAYFVIPKEKKLTQTAEARLKALVRYADMGSGFSLASCDLEIRGAGEILGANQSGHLEVVGLELYMELLKEAVLELKGEAKIIKKDIEITTPFPSYIPNYYIPDSSLRLKLYKKLSNCENVEELESMRDDFADIYGIYPQELKNLFIILETRIILQHVGIKSVNVAGNIIRLSFDKKLLENNPDLRDNVVSTFLGRPKVYQFTPDYKVIYSHKEEVDQNTILEFSRKIASQILP